MGTRESYAPGTFSWVELATSDGEAAKRFYGELFGWDYDDRDMGGGATYAMATRDGHHVGALYQSDQAPPHWNSYITVKSADDTARHVADTGGEVISEAFDVFDAGRMAVLKDPQGAVFSVWEPKEHIGAGLVNEPGALTWNDLMTSDVQGAVKFYSDLFGWEAAAVTPEGRPEDEHADPQEAERVSIRNEERLNGGIAKLPEGMGEAPPHWIVYFSVEDADAAARKIDELGGKIVVGPLEVPAGKLAMAQDPQGALFGIVAGEMDD
jgi:hypothetical protein